MLARCAVLLCLLILPLAARGQSPDGGLAPIEPIKPIASNPRRPTAGVMQGTPQLPNDRGQVWREYDIRPYTQKVTNTNRPEQAIVDWILRETGYEAWHSEPLGILSATPDKVRVYHTPEMHAVVSEVVDRFVNGAGQSHEYSVRVVSLGNPNWRVKAQPMLRSVPVQTPGIQAWVMPKEDAALLIADVSRRSDYRELSAPTVTIPNGQPAVLNQSIARQYTRDITLTPNVWPPYQPELASFNDGFTLEVNPLMSVDGRSIDAVVKCNIDQLEKLVPVTIDVASTVGPKQRAKIEVPQVSQSRTQERFRWPSDRVLLVSVGIVPLPTPQDNGRLLGGLLNGSDRGEMLILVERR